MIPLSDDNPTLRTPVVTYLLLLTLGAAWVLLQGAGLDTVTLAGSVCRLGLVPAELTGLVPAGTRVALGEVAGRALMCPLGDDALTRYTPLTSMFLHGGWGHLLGNCLFLWVFGNNVEDSMGRLRFVVFYLVCGLAAAAAHVLVDPRSDIPTVGASGAISGVMGAYLVLYPRVRVNLLIILIIFIQVVSVPAWLVLIYWFFLQLLMGLPQLSTLTPGVSGGVAVWAHIGGFVAGLVLIKLFENRRYTAERTTLRHRFHPEHP
ncbi:rhomboid family intramembrane serine protease [Myxococcaceae bacterium GXIMD 01537]